MFYASDFLSVTKEENLEWEYLKPEILAVITEHYTRGQPLFTEEVENDDCAINEDDSEAV